MLTTNYSPIHNAAVLRRPIDGLFNGRAGIYSMPNGTSLPHRKAEAAVTRKHPQSMSASLQPRLFVTPEQVATMSHIPQIMENRGPISFGMPSTTGHSPPQSLVEGTPDNQFGDGRSGLSFSEVCFPFGLGIRNSKAFSATREPFQFGEKRTDSVQE